MGEVSNRGGWLNEPIIKKNIVTFTAKVAQESMLGFGEWLNNNTGGKGEFGVNA